MIIKSCIFYHFYYSDNFFVNQVFLQKSVDSLLYMSIIISEERKITKVIQGMKEMRKNDLYLRSDCIRTGVIYFNDTIIYNAIYAKIGELSDYKSCFRLSTYSDVIDEHEFNNFYLYLHDMINDGFKITDKGINELYLHKDNYIPVSYMELVNEWFYQCDELLTDFRIFLRKNNIEIYDTLKKYRLEKLERELK